jgi:hypothetical protein
MRAFRAGVSAALAVERLTELALQLTELGLGTSGLVIWSRRRVVLRGFGSGLLDSHTDLLKREFYLRYLRHGKAGYAGSG